jgi:hypothetical protein
MWDSFRRDDLKEIILRMGQQLLALFRYSLNQKAASFPWEPPCFEPFPEQLICPKG